MDMSVFARKALEWEELTRQAQEIAAELEAATLEIGKTQTIGNVRVTFSNPRKSFDYQAAADGQVDDDTILSFTTVPAPFVDWRGICKHAGIEVVGVASGEAAAKIKLIG